jgi:hypothetical protein
LTLGYNNLRTYSLLLPNRKEKSYSEFTEKFKILYILSGYKAKLSNSEENLHKGRNAQSTTQLPSRTQWACLRWEKSAQA